MLAPGGSLLTIKVAASCERWTVAVAFAPEATSRERVSLVYPALLTVMECLPASMFVRESGVVQLGSVEPSSVTCAPWGVESIVSCPGTATGAEAFFRAPREFEREDARAAGSEV